MSVAWDALLLGCAIGGRTAYDTAQMNTKTIFLVYFNWMVRTAATKQAKP